MTTHLSKIHMKNNDWKERLNVVYSTNPDFNYEHGEEEETATPDKKQQKLRVSIEKKGRGGKTVTLVNGFIGTENDLKELVNICFRLWKIGRVNVRVVYWIKVNAAV